MAVAVAMIALLARGAGAFLVGSAGSSRIAAAVARGGECTHLRRTCMAWCDESPQ